jgi:hypothetical protein
MDSIPPDTVIHDMRQTDAFKSRTFSNFSKRQVRQAMYDSMKRGRVEPACHWCAELLASGHVADIWELLLLFLSKEIHLANPPLIYYLSKRFELFENISSRGEYSNFIHLRNHKPIRELLAEIVCNLSLSSKRPCFDLIKINTHEEFDTQQLPERFDAVDFSFHGHVLKRGDADELIIALNELGFHLSPKGKNLHKACFWLEWILHLEVVCEKRKKPLQCVERDYGVEKKYRGDVVWILWDLFQVYATEDAWRLRNLHALCHLFSIRYTTAAGRRRKYMLYLAAGLVCESLEQERQASIVANRLVLETVLVQIHAIYKEIKKNEVGHSTDYMYSMMDDKDAEFQSMLHKLEFMQSMDIATTIAATTKK